MDNINIYSAKLTFKRKQRIVIVEVRYDKKDKPKRKRFSFPDRMPEEIAISPDELDWIKYHEEAIITYHRKIGDDGYMYLDSRHQKTPTSLAQRLEQLVGYVHSIFKIQKIPSDTQKV